jgi:hypothetical protein
MKVNDQVFISKRSSGPDYTFLTQYVLFLKSNTVTVAASIEWEVWMFAVKIGCT